MKDDTQKAILNDFRFSFGIPYGDENGSSATASDGFLRCLVSQPPQIENLRSSDLYVAPEILRNDKSFDSFNADLWSLAVVLFVMLVGSPPWETASQEDVRYRHIVDGRLEELSRAWGMEISPLATDLLTKMFKEDPCERLSMLEVSEHPWVWGPLPPAQV